MGMVRSWYVRHGMAFAGGKSGTCVKLGYMRLAFFGEIPNGCKSMKDSLFMTVLVQDTEQHLLDQGDIPLNIDLPI